MELNEIKEGMFVTVNYRVGEVQRVENGRVYLKDNIGSVSIEECNKSENSDIAQYLKNKVSSWVDRTFNQIDLEVYETMTDRSLFEYIDPVDDSHIDEASEKLEEEQEEIQNEIDDTKESKEEIKHRTGDKQTLLDDIDLKQKRIDEIYDEISELENDRDSLNDDNYPIWSTLFEVKDRHWTKLINEGQKLGLGLISNVDCFNDTLFMTSCGHSFYGEYWIPLYIAVFDLQEQYKGIKFDNL